MALDFPSAPSLNQTYSFVDKTWIWNGTGWKLLGSSGPIINAFVSNTVTSNAYSANLATVSIHNLTLANASITLSVTGVPASQMVQFVLVAKQDATGGRVFANTGFWNTVKWVDGLHPTLTSTANKTDILTFITFDGGTTWFGAINMFNMG